MILLVELVFVRVFDWSRFPGGGRSRELEIGDHGWTVESEGGERRSVDDEGVGSGSFSFLVAVVFLFDWREGGGLKSDGTSQSDGGERKERSLVDEGRSGELLAVLGEIGEGGGARRRRGATLLRLMLSSRRGRERLEDGGRRRGGGWVL